MSAQALNDPFALVGTTLDNQYCVERVVGEGGFGVVYKGRHISLEQPVAIKALKVLLETEERAVQDALFAKFKAEAQLLYTLSQASLHIVRSMDFGAVTSPSGLWAPYMVLEWLEGRSLAADLDERRRRGARGRSLDEALGVLEGAAEGLSVAHQRRVAHRDVKPANFFLVADPSQRKTKVLDFGIAKVLLDDEPGGTKSKFASFTYAYAAPEQLDPRLGATGLATDVYAFALVVTELLTDRAPVDVRDVVSIMNAAKDPVTRPTPRARGGQVPDAVEAVCRRALAVEPRERYPTVTELWAALVAAARPASAHVVAAARSSGALPSSTPTGGIPQPPARASVQVPTPAPMPAPGPPPGAYPAHAPPRVAPGPLGPPRGGGPVMPHYTTGPLPQPQPTRWSPRRPVPSGDNTVIVFVVLMVLSGLFMGTCAVLHSAC